MAVETVQEYLAGFSGEQREVLDTVRACMLEAVPGGEERVRYGMPAVMLGGRYALHYAAWKKHLGIYPVARLDGELETEVAPYRAAKDSLNFVYARPIPYELITRVAAELAARRSAIGS